MALPFAAIDQFVSLLYSDAAHYFWVINGSKEETQREIIVDINTTVIQKDGATPTEDRFLLLFRDGQIQAVQKIPLDANVDCDSSEEV